ncbi:unnamed protein product [Spirodela intermedia]|uniref:Protein kinase domain-containing protein n=1 Tax=Spirodela intermedia TaxID=51605 RepID=A0A7I8INJ8_SPIIN|nr:unnamed protein product [Spirodela intermedia]CAA6659023.1 unnamed protein product [Spirodela intermedia]
MSPPPPPLPLRTPLSVVGVLLVLPCLVILLSWAASAETVAPAPLYIKCNSPFCAPFSPAFLPVRRRSGCGHPAFQIRCTPDNRSQITIAGFSFSILDFRGDSLLVSPCLGSRIDGVCVAGSSTAFPPSQIDLSSSPFLFSDESCSRLAMIHPCRSELLRLPPNCSAIVGGGEPAYGGPASCPAASPAEGLQYFPLSASQQLQGRSPGVRVRDVRFMADFLRSGIWIEWRLTEDVYSSCSNCWKQNGACGFNLSDPTHSFLCLAPDLHLQPPVFTYDQLCSSTGGFDLKCKIGDGGFGSVYLAQLEDGRSVAVKRLHRKHPSAATNSFCNEILILSSIHHPNLVRLHGYCCDPGASPELAAWPLRVSVALQTALALEYLHFSVKPPVVHRDITSSNIFIEKDMRIKVGDFGLSRLLCLPDPGSCSSGSASEYVCTGPQGTPGYLDQIITSPSAHGEERRLQLRGGSAGACHWNEGYGLEERQARDLPGPYGGVQDPACIQCVAGEKDDRPNARELVTELKRIQDRIQEDSKGS